MSAALPTLTPIDLIRRRDEIFAAYVDGCETGSQGMMPAEAMEESWRYSETLQRLATTRRRADG